MPSRAGVAVLVVAIGSAFSRDAYADAGDIWKLLPSLSLAGRTAFGARGSYLAGAPGGDSFGAGVASNTSMYFGTEVMSLRATGLFALGGGQGGAEGLYAVDLGVGARLNLAGGDDARIRAQWLGEGHGPFVRAGARGYLLGNDTVFFSSIEAPTGQLGYQYMAHDWILEAAFDVGLQLAGRYNVGDERRVLRPAGAFGGHLTVGYDFVRVEGTLERVEPHGDPETALVVTQVTACVRAGPIALCGDGRWWTGDTLAPAGTPSHQQITYAGALVGLWL